MIEKMPWDVFASDIHGFPPVLSKVSCIIIFANPLKVCFSIDSQ
jgi:hypothetical protein